MQLVFDFTVVDAVRPSQLEYCLFILKEQPDVVHTATYYSREDIFQVDDRYDYPADAVLYWAPCQFKK